MDLTREDDSPTRKPSRFVIPVVAVLGVLLVISTYFGIRKSRSDSLELMRRQGAALIESLALSADNAIKANSFFDLLIQEKFSDLAAFLESREGLDFSPEELADFAVGYGVDAILIYDDTLGLMLAGARGNFVSIDYINSMVLPEARKLVQDSSRFFDLQTISGNVPGDISMYYLEKTSDLQHVIVIVSDALFYSESKKNIGIGYLVMSIAQEIGIEYILFQTEQGIVFSSRKIGPILKIEKDPFLNAALNTDTVMSRFYDLNDREILELVRTFSSIEYGDGLFRIGLSLDKYNEIIGGFDRQMIAFSLVMFAAVVLTMMYLSGKQKRANLDRSIRRIQTLTEKVFDSINSALIAVSREGIIETANRQFFELFGTGEEELIGKKWDDLEFNEAVPFRDFFEGGGNSIETNTEYSIGAEAHYFLVNIARLHDPDNRPSGAVAIIYDYTHIRDLEQAAQRRERLSEMGDLAAGVAHEIRNPLNAISIAAQRLMSEFEPKENSEDFHNFARQIKSEAGRLNEIVTRFLSLTRSRSNIEPTGEISKVAKETSELLAAEAEKAGISIRMNIEPGIRAAVSEDRLKQLLINLMRNAMEACSGRQGEVGVYLRKVAGSAILSVTDNGPGIPKELRDKIFNPYFSTKEKGTGLGLSIVHQIVEEFKGSIEVVSPEEEGTEFRVTIPAK